MSDGITDMGIEKLAIKHPLRGNEVILARMIHEVIDAVNELKADTHLPIKEIGEAIQFGYRDGKEVGAELERLTHKAKAAQQDACSDCGGSGRVFKSTPVNPNAISDCSCTY